MAERQFDSTQVGNGLREAGLELSEEQLSTLASGGEIELDQGVLDDLVSGEKLRRRCQGILIYRINRGCGIYFVPPRRLHVCCLDDTP